MRLGSWKAIASVALLIGAPSCRPAETRVDCVQRNCETLQRLCSQPNKHTKCLNQTLSWDPGLLTEEWPHVVDTLVAAGAPVTLRLAAACLDRNAIPSKSDVACAVVVGQGDTAVRVLSATNSREFWPVLATLSVVSPSASEAGRATNAWWEEDRVATWIRTAFVSPVAWFGVPDAIVLKYREKSDSFLVPLERTLEQAARRDWMIAANAAYALGLLGDNRAERILLAALAQNRSESLALSAATALGWLRALSPAARAELEHAATCHWSRSVRNAARLAVSSPGTEYLRIERDLEAAVAAGRPVLDVVDSLEARVRIAQMRSGACEQDKVEECSHVRPNSGSPLTAKVEAVASANPVEPIPTWDHIKLWGKLLGTVTASGNRRYGLYATTGAGRVWLASLVEVERLWLARDPIELPGLPSRFIRREDGTLVVETPRGDMEIRDGEVQAVRCCGNGAQAARRRGRCPRPRGGVASLFGAGWPTATGYFYSDAIRGTADSVQPLAGYSSNDELVAIWHTHGSGADLPSTDISNPRGPNDFAAHCTTTESNEMNWGSRKPQELVTFTVGRSGVLLGATRGDRSSWENVEKALYGGRVRPVFVP